MGDAMSYQALYRRWRPQLFAELVGQEHITRTLQNALEQGRIAHAYLFCGPRGTGKTSAAKLLAKAVNCENGPAREPCNQCPSCVGIQSGRVMDVLEIDAASNRGIDEIRDLREKARYSPTEVFRKVYIIDEVHMLTAEAFNALLKTLEEPPGQVLFILATTESHKLPATIVSRCQRLDFRLIGHSEIVERLRIVVNAAERKITEEALHLIAEEAEGGLRDALSLLEQVMAFSRGDVETDDVLSVLGAVGRDVYFNMTEALLRGDLTSLLLILHEVVAAGKDLHHFTHQAVSYYRDLMVTLACEKDSGTLGVAPVWESRLRSQSAALGMGTIGQILSVLHELLAEVRWSAKPRLMWELAIFRIFGLGTAVDVGQVQPLQQSVNRKEFSAPVDVRETVQQAAEESKQGQTIQQLWPRVLEQVKKESVKTQALLLQGQPAKCDENVLEVSFGSAIHCEMMEATENRQCLQKVVSRMLGRDVIVRCTLNSQTPSPAAPDNGQEDLISTAVDIFQGTIVEDTSIS